ncbi:MAG: TAXI family TRAP transporter solute-binding subunit [Hyphomicrobiaceae bacterium]|nr:TAXI family TRAP transporter solute-binding subunit [Hyphomicrobiaceae bacterium]
MDSNIGRTIAIGFGVIAAFFGSLFAAFQARPDVPGRIVMATGNTMYHSLAETWREDLERNGVQLELRGTLQGFDTLKALIDPGSPVNAGFIKGGVVGSMQGKLAGARSKEWRSAELDKLRSVGRLFYEPIWVFSRGDLPITRLAELKGRRLLVGTRQSGSRRIAMQLLRANGLDRNSVTLIEEELTPEAAQFKDGKADVGILIEPPDTDRIQALLRLGNIRLMNFEEEATAYVNRFPALTKVVMPTGSVGFNPLIPSADITLLATTAALVVRADMDPALVNLLTYAVVNHPRSGFDRNGDPVLFYKAGEFPSASDPEFAVSKEARLFYKTGEMPLILRLAAPANKRVGVPFSVTAFMAAHGAKLVLLIPVLAVLLPLMRALPAIYAWFVRRRLLYWYRQLKELERQVDSTEAFHHIERSREEIERIDAGVRRIRVPLNFSDRLYDLRGHIDLVRQQLYAKRPPSSAAAAAE